MIPADHSNQHNTGESQQQGRLGTFAGVFTPSILTILGIILFLRLGYVTGSAGVGKILIILAIANTITILTSLSLAAVATNLKVKSGGDYYLISRTLGYKFGGSIGIVLYLAQSVSVAFYCIGFAEGLGAIIQTSLPPSTFAGIAVAALFVLAWLGADWATKFQYIVMLLLVLALGSFYLGGIENWQESVFLANWNAPENAQPFWLLFAIFFPAVTGFTQGVSMSGDLKDPGRSLPLGTFLAVGFSILVYVSVIIIFAGALPGTTLVEDYQAMQRVSKYGFLIDAGVIAATLSSAMASFMGGPRILQSLAADRIFPVLSFFAKGSGETNNPRRCIVLTGCIALFIISLGQLNLVAHIVSMFFLISYGLLNYATYYEADTGSASFRPRFRFFNKYLSLAGCLICLAILLALDTNNGILALAIMFAIFLYLKKRDTPSRWADSSRSHAFSRVRNNLQQMAALPKHQNDWYPHLLAFTRSRESRQKLLQFGDLICGDTGLISAVQIIPFNSTSSKRQQANALKELKEDIATSKVTCYPKIISAADFSVALSITLQAQGIGPLKGNTMLTNWYKLSSSQLPGLEHLKYGHNLRTAYRHGYNLVIFHCDTDKWDHLFTTKKSEKRIDIWWQDDDNSSRLMLLFAYLASRNKLWKSIEIRVLTSQKGTRFSKTRDNLLQLFSEARIPAEPHLVSDMKPETILEHSMKSSLVFLPFKIQQSRLTDICGYSLDRILPQLPAAAMVMAAEEIDLDSEPEEGVAAELAKAMDDLYDAEKRLHQREREEQKAVKEIERITSRLSDLKTMPDSETDVKESSELEQSLAAATKLKEQLFRKTAKTKARFDLAVDRVKALGGLVNDEK
jgi:amino acid transporter